MTSYRSSRKMFGRFFSTQNVSKTKHGDQFAQLFVDRLEDRRVLSVTAALIAGELLIDSSPGAGDSISIELQNAGDPGNEVIRIFDTNVSTTVPIPILDGGGIPIGNSIVSSQLTQGITANLADGDDQLNLQIPSGFSGPGSPLRVTIHGGDGNDSVSLSDNGAPISNPLASDTIISIDAESISLVEPVFDVGNVDLDLQGSLQLNTDQTLNTMGNVHLTGDVVGDGFDLTIDAGPNELQFDGMLGLPGREIDHLELTAGSIRLGGHVLTLGNQSYLGDIVLQDDVLFDSSNAGEIHYQSIVGQSFSMNADSDGTITFEGDVDGVYNLTTQGMGTTRIDAASISAIHNLELRNDILVATDTILSATGRILVQGPMNSAVGEFHTLDMQSQGILGNGAFPGEIILAGDLGTLPNGEFGRVSLTAGSLISVQSISTQNGEQSYFAPTIQASGQLLSTGGNVTMSARDAIMLTASGGIDAGTGDIALESSAGDITISGSGVSTSGSGTISMSALGVLAIDSAVSSEDGTLDLVSRENEVVLTSLGDVDSLAGKITVEAASHVRMEANASIETQATELLVIAGNALNPFGLSNGAILMQDQAEILGGSARVDLAARGDIIVGRVETTTEARLSSINGAIRDGGDSGGSDIAASTLGLSAANGIGSGNRLEVAVDVIAARNRTSGNIELNNTTGEFLTIGELNSTTIDGQLGPIQGVQLGGKREASISILHDGEMLVDAPVVNSSGGGIELVAAENLTVRRMILADVSNSNGVVKLTAGTDLEVLNTNPSAPDDADIIGYEVIGTAGSPVPVIDQVAVQTVYDPLNPDLFNPPEKVTDPINFDPENPSDLAQLPVRFGENVLIVSHTGSITQPVPSLSNIVTPQVLATGIATITGDFGRDSDDNFTFAIDWDSVFGNDTGVLHSGDPLFSHEDQAIIGVVPGVGPDAFDFDHRYFANPDPDHPAAPILITITAFDDANISFFADGGNVDLGAITMSSLAPVPGEGLAGAAVFDLSIEVPQVEVPRVQISESLVTDIDQTVSGQVDQVAETLIESDAAADVVFLIIQKIGPDGKVEIDAFGRPMQRIIEGPAAIDQLNHLPELHERLDIGHWKLFTKEGEDGQLMLVEDVELRDGKPVTGDETTQDRPPTAESVKDATPNKEPTDNTNSEQDEADQKKEMGIRVDESIQQRLLNSPEGIGTGASIAMGAAVSIGAPTPVLEAMRTVFRRLSRIVFRIKMERAS